MLNGSQGINSSVETITEGSLYYHATEPKKKKKLPNRPAWGSVGASSIAERKLHSIFVHSNIPLLISIYGFAMYTGYPIH